MWCWVVSSSYQNKSKVLILTVKIKLKLDLVKITISDLLEYFSMTDEAQETEFNADNAQVFHIT